MTKRKEWILLIILALVNFTHIVDFMIIMPLGTRLIPLFGIMPREFGWLIASYTVAAGISGFVVSFFIDRFDRKKSLIFAYLGFIAGTFFSALSFNFYVMVLARVVTGCFGGLISALIFSIVGDLIPIARRGFAMGIIMGGFSLASVFGVPFSLYLVSRYEWHMPFIVLGFFSIFILFCVFFILPSVSGHIKQKSSDALDVLRGLKEDSNQQKALLMTSFLVLGHFTVVPFISSYMVFNIGFTQQQLVYIYFFGGVASFVFSPIIGRLSDKLGTKKVFSIFVLLSLVPIYLITNMPPLPIIYAVMITTSLFILMGGRIIPNMAIVTSIVKPERRGGFMSLNNCVQQLSLGLASFIAGGIIKRTPVGHLLYFPWVGYLAIVFSLIAILLSYTIKK